MIEIFRRKYFLRIREIYFSKGYMPSSVSRDIDVYVQATTPPLFESSHFSTLLTDLSPPPDLLSDSLSKACRYEIRRSSEKDSVDCKIDMSPSQDVLQEFVNFYNNFASFKGLNMANMEKLEEFYSRNALIICSARDFTLDTIYSMHCYVSDGRRARLYYSATLPRILSDIKSNIDPQVVGRSNRQLHWRTILSIKESGLLEYDFGGVSNTTALKGIDDFKRQFGGKEVTEYNCYIPTSTAGRIALLIKKLYEKVTT